MPVGLRQFGGAVLNGKIYLVGGLDNHPENHPTDAIPTWRAFLCFDPATGEWQHNVVSYNGSVDDLQRPGLGAPTLPRNPTTPTAAYVCAHKGKVWVISGNPIGQNGALLLPPVVANLRWIRCLLLFISPEQSGCPIGHHMWSCR